MWQHHRTILLCLQMQIITISKEGIKTLTVMNQESWWSQTAMKLLSYSMMESNSLNLDSRKACTSPILKNSTMGITHATGVNVCVDGHINHLGVTNALWVQEHSIKPQCDHRHACVFINANQINWQHVSDCFRLVMSSTPQPRTMIVTMCGTSCWPRGQRECGGETFPRPRLNKFGWNWG